MSLVVFLKMAKDSAVRIEIVQQKYVVYILNIFIYNIKYKNIIYINVYTFKYFQNIYCMCI